MTEETAKQAMKKHMLECQNYKLDVVEQVFACFTCNQIYRVIGHQRDKGWQAVDGDAVELFLQLKQDREEERGESVIEQAESLDVEYPRPEESEYPRAEEAWTD